MGDILIVRGVKIRKIILFLLAVIFMICLSSAALAIPNPSAVYCEKMGYAYRADKTPEGEQGVCIIQPNVELKAWDFFKGKVGKEYSYCAKKGYNTETEHIDKGAYSEEYAVCVSKKNLFDNIQSLFGANAEEIRIPMHKLMEENKEPLIGPEYKLEKEEDPNISHKEALSASQQDNSLQQTSISYTVGDTLSSFDWRDNNSQDWVTSVKNQGGCGSCWAFSAIGAVEAKLNIDNNNPDLDYDLSEQQLVSCGGGGTCNGGWHGSALDYIKNTGVSDENCFPYTAINSACNLCSDWQNRIAKITNYHPVTPSTRAAYKQALVDYGPLAIAINASGWSPYSGGIFNGSNGSVDHAVLLVGYNDAENYWIIKNSWGPGWGESGYMRLSYTNNPITIHGYVYAVEQTIEPSKKGTLQPYLINLNDSINATKNNFFNFSAGVRCIGGSCGDVNSTLTLPPAPSITCSEIWGSDCSEGPPESFDNNFDDCSTGANSDDSIDEIWISSERISYGGEIEVICQYSSTTPYWGELYIYYRNSSSAAWKQKYSGTGTSSSPQNFSVKFVPDLVEGVHQVRCICDYEGGDGECAGGIYYDNDDANFSVYNHTSGAGKIPMDYGAPFYTISQNPINCTNMTNQSTCNQTWQVNATEEINSSWTFYTIYESDLDGVETNKTEKVTITIVEKEEESQITLSGYILNTTNKPLNATVLLENESGEWFSNTDENGYFEFTGLAKGLYGLGVNVGGGGYPLLEDYTTIKLEDENTINLTEDLEINFTLLKIGADLELNSRDFDNGNLIESNVTITNNEDFGLTNWAAVLEIRPKDDDTLLYFNLTPTNLLAGETKTYSFSFKIPESNIYNELYIWGGAGNEYWSVASSQGNLSALIYKIDEEEAPINVNLKELIPNSTDSDNDGLPDYIENEAGTDILKNDTDNDGLSDYDEYLKYKTSPLMADSDGDGIPDNNWDERREYAYTIKAIGKVAYPYDIATMNDFFQDALIIEEVGGNLTYEAVLYPYAQQMIIPEYYPLNLSGMDIYINKSTAINFNDSTIAGVNAIVGTFSTDYNATKKLVEWIDENTDYISDSCPETFEYLVTDDNVTKVNDHWCDNYLEGHTEEELLNDMIYGASMFENRIHGSCGSVSTLTATVLRAANISTRLVQSIPMIPMCNEPIYLGMINNITNSEIRDVILENLDRWDCSTFTNHFWNEVNINGEWVRVDLYEGSGIGAVRSWCGPIIKTISFPDWTEVDWANTWGKYPKMSNLHTNPYDLLSVSDQYPIHTEYYSRKFNISLTTGWNLLSFPLSPINKSINYVFNNINYSKIFTYNRTWLYYYNETNNNFNAINETFSYWIKSLNNQTLEIEGTKFNNLALNLNQGWNLIGYPILNQTNISEFFKDINITTAFAYNG
ncbi:MAG: DUF333 domain-containing protein, partial [Nanoarchaeota archaeon]|nr:DUF333 domain-containing protein [Nanoarchaeota archaeon]